MPSSLSLHRLSASNQREHHSKDNCACRWQHQLHVLSPERVRTNALMLQDRSSLQSSHTWHKVPYLENLILQQRASFQFPSKSSSVLEQHFLENFQNQWTRRPPDASMKLQDDATEIKKVIVAMQGQLGPALRKQFCFICMHSRQ